MGYRDTAVIWMVLVLALGLLVATGTIVLALLAARP